MSPAADPNDAPPAVTVAMPAWNAAATVQCSVRSIIGQTFSDWELIIVDDGSDDGTAEQIGAIGDPRIILLRDGARRGLAARLNQIIERARGKYIARMDADDVAFPRRLELQVEHLERNRTVDLLGTRALAIESDGRPIGLLPFRQHHAAICRRPWLGFYLPHPTWMGRLAWFRQYGYRIPEVHRAEDQDLLLRSYAKSRFECLAEVLLGYRLSPSTLRRTLTVRYSVARAQARAHLGDRRPGFAVLGAGAALAKGLVDIALVAAGKKLRTARGLEPANPPLLEEWGQLWRSLHELDAQGSKTG